MQLYCIYLRYTNFLPLMFTLFASRMRIFALAVFLLATQVIAAQEFDPVSCYGGRSEFRRFLKQEMVYPEKALAEGTEGTVTLLFVVNADGSTRNARIFCGVSPEIDAEAMRIFKKVLWEPAVLDGDNVPSEAILNIPFRIKRYHRWCKQRGYEQPEFPHQPVNTSPRVYQPPALSQHPAPILPEDCETLTGYVATHIRYPVAALRHGIEGTATVSFVVEPNGNISNLYAEHYLGGGCTEEMMRIIRSLHWQPGIKNGEAVRSQMHFSFSFKVPDADGVRLGVATSQQAVH